MDENRQLRFLVPPFFTLGSLALGTYIAGIMPVIIKAYSLDKLISIAAGLAAFSIPLGFLITSASICSLRFILKPLVRGSYEAHLSPGTRKMLRRRLRSELLADEKWDLYATATFDHELLAPGVNGWIQRRWTTFNLSVHCITALALAHVVAIFIHVPQTCRWFLFSTAVIIILVINAKRAWDETMRMIEFQASRTP